MSTLARLWDWPAPPSTIESTAVASSGVTWQSNGGEDDGATYPAAAYVRFGEDGPIVVGLVIALPPEDGGLWELRAAQFATDGVPSGFADIRELVPDRARRIDIGQHVRALVEMAGHRT